MATSKLPTARSFFRIWWSITLGYPWQHSWNWTESHVSALDRTVVFISCAVYYARDPRPHVLSLTNSSTEVYSLMYPEFWTNGINCNTRRKFWYAYKVGNASLHFRVYWDRLNALFLKHWAIHVSPTNFLPIFPQLDSSQSFCSMIWMLVRMEYCRYRIDAVGDKTWYTVVSRYKASLAPLVLQLRGSDEVYLFLKMGTYPGRCGWPRNPFASTAGMRRQELELL